MFKKNYLFFSMEKDTVQKNFAKVSAVMTDENFKTTDTFYNFFGIKDAEETSDVLNKISNGINASTIFVVWSSFEYLDFMELCKEANISFEKCKVVFFKRTLKLFIEKQHSFSKFLRMTELYDSDKPLGQNINDVQYLKSLYNVFLESFKLHKNRIKTQFCIAKGSNILHDKNCHHAKKAKEISDATPEALFEGFTYCKHCAKKQALFAYSIENNIALLSYKQFSEKVYELCENLSIDCNILSNIIYLNTGKAHWRIILKNNKVSELLHESYHNFKFYKNSPGDMKFHKQHIEDKNVESDIDYIYSHDKNKVNTLAPRKKVSRMEYLFSMIETGQKPVSAYAI